MSLDSIKKTVHESEMIIKSNENLVGMGLWNIANELKLIRDTRSYEEKSFTNFSEYVESELGYERSHCYNLISIAEKYSVQSIGQVTKLGITKILALTSIKDEEEREEFIEENPVEDMTTRELRQAIKDRKEEEKKRKELEETARAYKHQQDLLRKENRILKSREPEVIEKKVEVEVVPEDYKHLKSQKNHLEKQLRDLQNELSNQENNKEDFNRLRKEYENKVNESHELRKQIDSLVKEDSETAHKEKLKDSALMFSTKIHTFLNDVGGLAWLTEYLDELDDYDKRSYFKALDLLEGWVLTVKSNINKEEF